MSPFLPLWILLAVAAIINGLLIRRHARRPIGAAPHCRRCDYLLTGNTSAVCPECGLALTEDNVIRGERFAKRRLFWSGTVLLLIGLLIVVALAADGLKHYDWYRLRFTAGVLRDAGSIKFADADRAWTELERRRRAGGLAESDEQEITQFAVDRYAQFNNASAAPSPILWELENYLANRAAVGKLSDAQADQFFKAAVYIQMRLRPYVFAGDRAPVQILARGLGYSGGQVWSRQFIQNLTVSGEPEVGRGDEPLATYNLAGNSRFLLKPRPPGDYSLTMVQRSQVFAGTPRDHQNSRLLREWTTTTQTTLHVIARDPAKDVQLVEKPELTAIMKRSIQLKHLIYRSDSATLTVVIDFRTLPEDVAFDVFARYDGHDYLLGEETVHKGENLEALLFSNAFEHLRPSPSHLDIILRPNPAAARKTTDIFQIWNGQIILKDLPVKRDH